MTNLSDPTPAMGSSDFGSSNKGAERQMSMATLSKFEQLRMRIREARRAIHREDEHGASVQLKNVSFEVVLPEEAEAQTLGDAISPLRIAKSFVEGIKQLPKKKKTIVQKKKILDDVSFAFVFFLPKPIEHT